MTKVHELVATYLEWLKDNILVREMGEWIEISAPFVDRHNDYLQIYVKRSDSHYILSDDGYIINDLMMSGVDLSSPRRKELLDQIVRGFGVQLVNDELTVEATPDTFAQRKHSLLQAMLVVNDLFLTARTTVRGLFIEDVEHFLHEHQIRYVASVQMAGRSGLSHTFDYVIPAWQKVPERILKAINTPTKEKIQSLLFAWFDIREIRRGAKMYAFVNDTEKPLSGPLAAACKDNGVEVVPWSKRNEFVHELTA